MTSLHVYLQGVRHELTPDRAWSARLRSGALLLTADGTGGDESEVVGTFVHFAAWIFRPAAHPALDRVQLDAAALSPSTMVRLARDARLDLVPTGGAPLPAPQPARPARPAQPVREKPGDWRTIGRAGAGADIEIDDPTLASVQARLRPLPGGEWAVIAGGGPVFVNDRELSSGPVREDDLLVLGQTVLRVADLARVYEQERRIVPAPRADHGYAVRATHLSVANRKKTDLHDLDFEIAAGSLVAVVGPSGAGKSTLMGALLGGRRIVGGDLTVAGVRLSAGAPGELARQLVRLVPQRDELFADLTVAETVDGAARLRLGDQSAMERRARVNEVIAELGLAERAGARVGTLSGGERRRVSIATELVARPRLLLLDEPTSGLDLGRDRALMRTLRKIAGAGCTVVVITHSVAHLDLADQVLVLSAQGRLAHAGPPASVVDQGRPSGWADLLDRIGRKPADPKRNRRLVRLPQNLLGRQATLILRRGPWYALGQALLPVGGAVAAAVAAEHGLRPAPELAPALATLITVAALSGAALTYLEVVRNQGILKRDWRAGAGAGRLIAVAFVAYAVVCGAVGALMIAALHLIREGFEPAFGVPPVAAEALIVILVLVSSAALGLLVSVSVGSVEQAVTANTAVAVAQVVLCGSLFELPGWLSPVTWVLPARLGFAAAAGYGDLNAQREGRVYTDAMWAHDDVYFWSLTGALVVLTVVTLLAATRVLARRWQRDVE
ncbi:ATP-binding cassette domain-containing protein [Actinoplanes sp. NPDC026670]|uniref:ATP-binding cassette domain-containing protein n=1 Tax=Actinoplanes sp. NPDC026670 TaxID=3154700 RepID=UPI0033D74FE8